MTVIDGLVASEPDFSWASSVTVLLAFVYARDVLKVATNAGAAMSLPVIECSESVQPPVMLHAIMIRVATSIIQ